MRSLADHLDLYTFVNLRKPNLASPVRWVRCYGKRIFPLSRRRCLRFLEQQLTHSDGEPWFVFVAVFMA